MTWTQSLWKLLAPSIIAMLVALFAPCVRTQAQEIDIPYQKFVLSNGLTVIVHEDHKAPIVAINVWYHVGSKDEKPGKTGFAHLFEHLYGGGSVDALERIGATEADAETLPDSTIYYENVPTPAVDFALWLESDRMAHLSLTKKNSMCSAAWCRTKSDGAKSVPTVRHWSLFPRTRIQLAIHIPGIQAEI